MSLDHETRVWVPDDREWALLAFARWRFVTGHITDRLGADAAPLRPLPRQLRGLLASPTDTRWCRLGYRGPDPDDTGGML